LRFGAVLETSKRLIFALIAVILQLLPQLVELLNGSFVVLLGLAIM